MTGFTLKKLGIEQKSGEKLKTTRLKRRITLADVSKKLKIRTEYLIALEQEEYGQLPSGVYGRKFLKEYCRFLNLDYKSLLVLTPFNEDKNKENPFSQKILRKHKFLIFPKLVRNLIFIILFLTCLLYLLIYFRHLISPPNLSIEYPDKNLVTTELILQVRGQSDPETEIKINNTSIMSAQDGSFSQEIKLKQGLNKLTISAKKKYGQENIIQRQILVEENYEQAQ
ncbi:helix-turn-helix domain-containing protein [Patescibacteria group bacterium]|nr:helix-turn-helix domain-containing protein [Patescibacteria group bacterium]